MISDEILEGIGYVSSVLILVSLLMTSVVKFRVINAVGSIVFTVYALLIASYPTAALNFCLVLVDLWFLWRALRRKTSFSVLQMEAGDGAAEHFLQFYLADIQNSFPGFSGNIGRGDRLYLVYADANPVGLLIGREAEAGSLEVALDYSCPSHRDCSVGSFLYAHLARSGVKRLVAEAGEEKHDRYLRRMGFVLQGDHFVKELS